MPEKKLLRRLEDGYENLKELKELYMRSFPEYERKPFEMITEGSKKGVMEAWIAEEEGSQARPAGLAFCILSDDLIVLDYLAVNPAIQSKGLGSRILRELEEQYEQPLLVEIESTLASADEERQRRKAFYLRNGLYDLHAEILLFGAEMELMATSPDVTFDDYFEVMNHYFDSFEHGFILDCHIEKIN